LSKPDAITKRRRTHWLSSKVVVPKLEYVVSFTIKIFGQDQRLGHCILFPSPSSPFQVLKWLLVVEAKIVAFFCVVRGIFIP
jgi:hypothetical protein